MKRIALVVVPILVVILVVALGISSVMAAKPQDVIEKSNGFPSGPHFNLNIHGKKADFTCDSSPGGRSVFVDAYGTASIQYVSNKKASVTELKVLDPCAVDGGTAKVQLPYKVEVDGTLIPAEGYYVFARILGKPNHGKDCPDGDCPSKIILDPNVVVQACNDPGDPDFGDYTDCLWTLGLITDRDSYEATPEEFVRFDPVATKGKGKSKARDITHLFTWSGWVYDASLDDNGDGVIDENDVPISYDDLANGGNGNGTIDPDEFENWRDDQVDAGLATYYENEWIFNIADLVVTQQDITNDGTKLLQVRFYPVATTEYVP